MTIHIFLDKILGMEVLIATIGVFVAECYGNFVGGGSLVTQAVLQNILHFDIKPAMALDNAAVIGSNLGMAIALGRKYTIKWWIFPFTLFQVIGALLGAWLLVIIDVEMLKLIFAATIILLVIKNVFFSRTLHENQGFVESHRNFLILFFITLFIGTYNAAFVIGDWMIALLLLTSLLGFKYQHASFVLALSSLFAQSVASYQYFIHGLLDLHFLLPMFCATLVSGLLVGTLLDKIHSKHLETFLRYLSIVFVIYLLWGIFG